MLILLPPSETKADGGDGPPLDLATLGWPELTPSRTRIANALVRLAERPKAAAKALDLGPTQLAEVERNAQLLEAPTLPAIERYTGVLFEALAVQEMSATERQRALPRIAIGSALFGLVRADDAIPAYRLSAGTKLPRIGTLGSVWKQTAGSVLETAAARGLVVDLRSGAYAALAPARSAVAVRVLDEAADGSRSVVSHFNKATKGRVARILATSPRRMIAARDVEGVLRSAGFEVEVSGTRLDVITRQRAATTDRE